MTDVDLSYNEYDQLYKQYLEQHNMSQLTDVERVYEEKAKDYGASYILLCYLGPSIESEKFVIWSDF